MSILIKGMEMPESCHKCEFIDILPTCPCRKMEDGDFWYNVSLAVDVHKDCPLVPVPPHGRLTDADALEEYFVNDPSCLTIFDAIKKLQGMPTIIPEEEGE